MATATKKTPAYTLEMKINGEVFTRTTNDLDEAIQDLKPEMVYIETYVTATKGKATSERKLNLIQSRKLFNDAMFRQIFINNLLLN